MATERGGKRGGAETERGGRAQNGGSKKRGKGKRKVCGGGPKGAKERGVEAGGGEGVSAMFLNAQSLGNKMSELRAVVSLERPDIVAVNETWTNDAIDNGMLGIQGYEIVELWKEVIGGTRKVEEGAVCWCMRAKSYAYGELSERQTLPNVYQSESSVDAKTLMCTMSIGPQTQRAKTMINYVIGS